MIGADHRDQNQHRRRLERERVLAEQLDADVVHRRRRLRVAAGSGARLSWRSAQDELDDQHAATAPRRTAAGRRRRAAARGSPVGGSSVGTFSSMTTNRNSTMMAPA